MRGAKDFLQMQSGLRGAEKGMGGSWVSVLLKATSVFGAKPP